MPSGSDFDKILYDVAVTKINEENSRKDIEERDEIFRRNGVETMPGKAPDLPDDPPCDGCGKNWSGKNKCAGCMTVFYCSKECQTAAWKQGHKKECKGLKAEVKATSGEVVNAMVDTSLPCVERVNQLKRLAGGGFHEAAVKLGLNEAIQGLMKEDVEFVLKRFQEGECVSYVNWVICVLFRGGRRKGHAMGKEPYTNVDGHRCKSYVMSSPDAFEDWFQASMETITCFVNRDIARIEPLRVNGQRTARDVIATWTLVFVDKKVSKAIILGQTKQPDDAAVKRAKWIAKQIKQAFTKILNAPEGVDIGNTIEGYVRVVGAQIMLRLKEYKVPVDFLKLLGLKGIQKNLYKKMSEPIADHMIRKGRAIQDDEMKIILQGRRIEY